MAKAQLYPWTTLEHVGDYFFVLESFRPYLHMNATVVQRNRQFRDRMKYACVKTTYGSIIMVVQVRDEMPQADYEVVEGMYARSHEPGPAEGQAHTFGKKPIARKLTTAEKVSRMSRDVRLENLPWWWEDGHLIWNTQVTKRREDVDAYVTKSFNFTANDDYPDYYNLDENLIKRPEGVVAFEAEEDEDEWAGYSADGQPPEEQ